MGGSSAMEMIFCPNCGQTRGFKRALGFGTLFMVFLTLGVWLLAIPLYPARCISCGLTRSSAFWENVRSNPRRAITVASVLGAAGVVLVMFAWLSPEEHQPAPIIKGPNYNEIGNPTSKVSGPEDPLSLRGHQQRLDSLRKQQDAIDAMLALEYEKINDLKQHVDEVNDDEIAAHRALVDRWLLQKQSIDAAIQAEERAIREDSTPVQ
jgi:hypothetical protein